MNNVTKLKQTHYSGAKQAYIKKITQEKTQEIDMDAANRYWLFYNEISTKAQHW